LKHSLFLDGEFKYSGRGCSHYSGIEKIVKSLLKFLKEIENNNRCYKSEDLGNQANFTWMLYSILVNSEKLRFISAT
jgi:hypothetical protein